MRQDAFVLADDVVFLTMDSISQELRRNFQHHHSDVVISLRHSRARSKVIAKEAAALLQIFSTSQTLAEAIFHHATATAQDPQQLAEESFAMLMEMQEEGFLLSQNSSAVKPLHVFSVGQRYYDFIIKAVCQVTADSAVYKTEIDAGVDAALKIFRHELPNTSTDAFETEKQCLQELDGTINPRHLNHGTEANTSFLLMEWCNCLSCEQAVAPHRCCNVQQNMIYILDCCLAVLQAIQQLHRQGWLHGDIHPENILIDENKSVKILDYAFATKAGCAERHTRVGLDIFYEPEMAAALLDGKAYPAVTEQSEQYALAVLLYRLITGHDYLPFSLEPLKAYQQILQQSPLSFSAFDLLLPDCFDLTFQKALAKDPSQRFASLADFINAIRDCKAEVMKSSRFFIAGRKNAEENFLQMLVRKYDWQSPLLQKGLSNSPTCSAHDGAAGIAYFLYRTACANKDANLLALADVWANRASAFSTDYEKAFYTTDGQLSEATVGRRGLLHSPTGVHLVQSLISGSKGDQASLADAVERYIHAGQVSCANIDLTTGKAGLLVGSAILYEHGHKLSGLRLENLQLYSDQLMQELWNELDGIPPANELNPVGYLGMAHGWAGIIYATVKWCRAAGSKMPPGVHRRIDELAQMATYQNGGASWPISHAVNETRWGWCHGNAGYIFLWFSLFEFFKEERFRTLAIQSGQRLLPMQQDVPHLCCGLAGRAYAFLRLSRLTGDPLYQKKLTQIRWQIVEQLSSPHLRNNSLYKGDVGIGVLFAELQQPSLARMPLFE